MRLRLAFNSGSAVVALLGLVFQFANLQGCYRHEARQAFLGWVAESKVGLPMETPAAVAFASRFPSPRTPIRQRPTHVTKTVLATADGAIMSAQFNYMYANESRSEHVASIDEVRAWAAETGYEWWAFWATAIGLIGMVASSGLDWREHLKAEGGGRSS